MRKVYHAAKQHATQLFLFPLTKVCSVCDNEKPLSDFHKHNGFADKHNNVCKECRKTGRKKTAIAPFPPTKPCGTCGIEKSLDEFTPQTDGKYGRVAHCKKCVNAKGRAERIAKYATEHANDPIPRPGYKFCINCKEEKLFNAYSRGRNECKKCRVAYSAANTKRKRNTPEYQAWLQDWHSRPTYKARNRARVCRWRQTPRGRELGNAASRRHNQTPTRKEFDRQRRLTPGYQNYQRNYAHHYAQTYPEKVNEVRMKRVARQKRATVEKVSYQHILERDGFWCYLCEKPIDPTIKKEQGSLTFDHFIPLAPRLGNPQGTHSENNIRPAHKICNFRKSNKRFEDLTPFDRRGPDA